MARVGCGWVAVMGWLMTIGCAGGYAQEPGDRVVMSYPLQAKLPEQLRIVELDAAKGRLRLAIAPRMGQLGLLQGNLLLALYDEETTDYTHLVPVQVTEILAKGEILATFRPGAAEVLKPGPVLLFMPFGGEVTSGANADQREIYPATTAQLRELPDVIAIGAEPNADDNPNATKAARIASMRARSVNNLKEIMRALHNYNSANANFPPAVIYGPDGKPWHSWRVLLLPWLEKQELLELFNQYNFREPWDAPVNRKVVETVVNVYQDPIHGKANEPVTHYAVLVGKDTMFRPEGERNTVMERPQFHQDDIMAGRTRMREIIDGNSNTLAVVPVAAERKIPWAKPEDIAFGANFPGLGKPGGIAAPYPGPEGQGRVAPVALADASVWFMPDTIALKSIRAMATIRGGEIVDVAQHCTPAKRNRRESPVLQIVRSPGGVYSARID